MSKTMYKSYRGSTRELADGSLSLFNLAHDPSGFVPSDQVDGIRVGNTGLGALCGVGQLSVPRNGSICPFG